MSVGNPYPNPFADNLTIPVFSATTQMATATLYDLNGLVLYNYRKNMAAGENQWLINLADTRIPNGVYLLQIKMADRMFVKKLVKS